MRYFFCFMVLLQIGAASAVCAGETEQFTSATDKISYAVGVETARNFIIQGIKLNPDMLRKGMDDVISGKSISLSEKELRNIIISVQSDVRRKRSADKLAAEKAPHGKAGTETTAVQPKRNTD